jgi:hypothetical protein
LEASTFVVRILPTRNPADARKHETNLPLTKAASAESDDVTRNSHSGLLTVGELEVGRRRRRRRRKIISKNNSLPRQLVFTYDL